MEVQLFALPCGIFFPLGLSVALLWCVAKRVYVGVGRLDAGRCMLVCNYFLFCLIRAVSRRLFCGYQELLWGFFEIGLGVFIACDLLRVQSTRIVRMNNFPKGTLAS